MADIRDQLQFSHGPAWSNRLALAPLTNLQSNADGTLSEDEINWLLARARGGFGMVMTAAAYTRGGRFVPGQLGVCEDVHLPGLEKLAAGIRKAGAVSAVQINHGGIRTIPAAADEVVAPFEDPESGARALTTGEVQQIIADFASAAVLAEKAGFDGVEIHGAHSFLLCTFLDPKRNTREDNYGGSYINRTRIFHEVISTVREATGKDFQLGLRLSPERHGVDPAEVVQLTAELAATGDLDYLDISLWDVRKHPEANPEAEQLISSYTALDLNKTALGVAGKITGSADANWCLTQGADFALIGRGGIFDYDFATKALADPNYLAPTPPLTREQLREQYLGEAFINYLANRFSSMIAD